MIDLQSAAGDGLLLDALGRNPLLALDFDGTLSPLVPLPHAAKVTFTAPGTFKYICFLHGSDMAGTVIVTP